MFHPEEWTKLANYTKNGIHQCVYQNEHTGLLKLQITFTHEQQQILREHECKQTPSS